MRLVIAVVGMIWAGSAGAQDQAVISAIGGITPAGSVGAAQMNEHGMFYSTPAPGRDWNLLIESADHATSLTPHLYKEECEKLSSALFNRILPSFSECFETPK